MTLRAVVDRTECFSYQHCVETLPTVFVIDADGTAVALDMDAPEELLRETVDGCPRSAIAIVENGAQSLSGLRGRMIE